MKNFFITCLFILSALGAQSQILITLLLGDKLNSDKLEFGLESGINFLNISNTPNAKNLTNWNLGFYFDFKLNPKLFIHTGVLVKSKMGCSGLTPYSLNDPNLDTLFIGGSIDRKLNYFNVPGLIRYRIIDYFHVEGGIQAGLRYKSYDKFTQEIESEDDLVFTNEITKNFTTLDFGALAGIGYKLKKGTGITLSAKYYYGLVDIDKTLSGAQHNSAFYINCSIPIGKEKKKE